VLTVQYLDVTDVGCLTWFNLVVTLSDGISSVCVNVI
jgi:hypothetical protein